VRRSGQTRRLVRSTAESSRRTRPGRAHRGHADAAGVRRAVVGQPGIATESSADRTVPALPHFARAPSSATVKPGPGRPSAIDA
jgi:hypothetical protein